MATSNHNRILSIIVVSFNERNHVGRLKTSIDNLANPENLQIETLLIDGGSTDGTQGEAETAGYDLIEVLPGASIPVCRNAGAQKASGRWIAYVDADCELSEQWLVEAWHWLQQDEPCVIGWPVAPPSPGTWVQTAWHVHWTHKNPNYETIEGRNVVRHEAFRLLATRNMLMHREVFDQLEGFDENLPTGEDTDFVFRANQRGLKVLADPGLQVLHYGEPATLVDFYKQQIWHANRSAYTKIMAESGGQTGGNAPKFTLLFLITFCIGSVGVIGAITLKNYWALGLLLPLMGLVGLPSLRTALSARKLHLWPHLAILYFVYGLARAMDLVGFNRVKKSWKVKA